MVFSVTHSAKTCYQTLLSGATVVCYWLVGCWQELTSWDPSSEITTTGYMGRKYNER